MKIKILENRNEELLADNAEKLSTEQLFDNLQSSVELSGDIQRLIL